MKKNDQNGNEEICIDKFLIGYSRITGCGFKVCCRPDQFEESQIDAIATDGKEVLAIEHTSIDSYEKQRWFDDIFSEIFSHIEKNLKEKFDGWNEVLVVDYEKTKPRDRKKARKSLEKWLVEEVPNLPYGRSELQFDELKISFKFYKRRSGKRMFGFCRPDPEDSTFNVRVKDLVEEKTGKFQKNGYKNEIKILIIESNDIALMSPAKMQEAWLEADKEGVKNVADQIWYVDSSGKENYYLHPLYSRQSLPPMEKHYIRV